MARTTTLPPSIASSPEKRNSRAWTAAGFLTRRDCQFHWHDRDYRDFEHFLESFTADKRKKVHRERRRIAEAGIRMRALQRR